MIFETASTSAFLLRQEYVFYITFSSLISYMQNLCNMTLKSLYFLPYRQLAK